MVLLGIVVGLSVCGEVVSGDFDETGDGVFGDESDDAGAEFFVDVVVEGGESEDSVFCCCVPIFVYVAFDDEDVRVFFGYGFEYRAELVAGSAPFCPEVYEYWGYGGVDDVVEVVIVDFDHNLMLRHFVLIKMGDRDR